MKGIIIVNKEKDMTSRDVVNSLCKVLGTKKVGHTGTLDPMAEGVLIVCFGKYTKLVDLITAKDKEYIAGVKLGVLTDTLDITGKVLETSDNFVDKKTLETVFSDFPNIYEQEVPIYSAVKIDGKKLYEYARNGEEITLPKRTVEIKKIELLDYLTDGFTFKVSVSKGTYIRSLIKDICGKFGLYGSMSSLIRTQQGNVDIKNSYKLEDIKLGNYKVLSARDVLDYETINLTEEEKFLILNGVKINKNVVDGYYFMYYLDEEIAVYEFIDGVGKMKVFLKYE